MVLIKMTVAALLVSQADFSTCQNGLSIPLLWLLES
jgi:hypothetical protein